MPSFSYEVLNLCIGILLQVHCCLGPRTTPLVAEERLLQIAGNSEAEAAQVFKQLLDAGTVDLPGLV